MPELPEVEVAARNLRRWLLHKKIEEAHIPPTRIVRGQSPKKIRELLTGATVKSVERRGKWLRLTLSTGTLFSHLGMTGKWVRRDPDAADERYIRARIEVADGSIRYRDPRLFGRLIAADGETIPEWDALGPDPLEQGLDAAFLVEKLKKISRSIKETLLDQRLFAGVGNIQATEALWRARIHPERKASSLEAKEVKALVKGIDDSIAFTLDEEDSPEITYVEEPGSDNPFKIYAREGEKCPRCKATLKRITQGGRSTVYCPKCQQK